MSSNRIWAPLRSTGYRRLWSGQMVSVISDKVDQIALGILVYRVTGSMLQMGVMLAIATLPAALFGLPAGALVDRWDHRLVMVVSDAARALLVFCILFVDRSVYAVYALAFLVGFVSLFFEPAKLSLIPDLVERDQLMAVNSLDNASSSVAELFGLAFAGTLVAIMGYRVAFAFDAATFAVSALFVLSIGARRGPRVPVPEAAPETARPRLLEEIGSGLRYIAGVPVLRELLSVYMLVATGISASITIVYLLALKRYDAGASGLATLDAAITVGLLLGSFAVGRTGIDGAGRRFIVGLCAFGALFLALAAAPGMLIAAALLHHAGGGGARRQRAAPGMLIAAALLLASGVANMWFQIPLATLL